MLLTKFMITTHGYANAYIYLTSQLANFISWLQMLVTKFMVTTHGKGHDYIVSYIARIKPLNCKHMNVAHRGGHKMIRNDKCKGQ